jgi:hypothetical protein
MSTFMPYKFSPNYVASTACNDLVWHGHRHNIFGWRCILCDFVSYVGIVSSMALFSSAIVFNSEFLLDNYMIFHWMFSIKPSWGRSNPPFIHYQNTVSFCLIVTYPSTNFILFYLSMKLPSETLQSPIRARLSTFTSANLATTPPEAAVTELVPLQVLTNMRPAFGQIGWRDHPSPHLPIPSSIFWLVCWENVV